MISQEKIQESAVEILNHFIERADKLLTSSLMRSILDEKGLIYTIHVNAKANEFFINYKRQDSEQVDAFLFTLRIFIHKKDSISLNKVGKLISSLDVDKKSRDRYAHQLVALNDYLDNKSMITIGGDNPTNREILETFLFGYLGHVKIEKAIYIRYKNWVSHADIKEFLDFLFISILINFVDCLRILTDCCRAIAEELII